MVSGFMLFKPGKTRRAFLIITYQRIGKKKVYGAAVESAELAALNRSLKDGTLSETDCLVQIKTVILPELKRRAGVKTKAIAESHVSDHNLKVFKAFWNDEYRRKRLERSSTAKDEFITALRIFEPLSLHSATIDDIQDHWDKKEKGTRHKRYGNRINQLLSYLRRGFAISTDRATVPELKWVTWSELEEINAHVNNPVLRDLYRTLYGTGARLGEVFLLTPRDLKENRSLFIHKQVTPKGEMKPYTKNKKAHDTLILDEALEAVHRWAAVADKVSYRKRCQHPLIDAALKAFPTEPLKQISPHKLRHSYVKQMLTLGVPLDRVAQFLGDRVSTIETSYRQWTVTDSEIDHVREIMADGYKRLKKSR